MVVYTYDETIYTVSVIGNNSAKDNVPKSLFKYGREDSPAALPSVFTSAGNPRHVAFIDLDSEEAASDATGKIAQSSKSQEKHERGGTDIGDTSRRPPSPASHSFVPEELCPYLWEFESLFGDPVVGSNITRNEAKFGDAKTSQVFAYYYTSGDNPLEMPPQDRIQGPLKPGDVFLHRVTKLDKYQIFLYRDKNWVMQNPGEESQHPESADRILVLRGCHAYPTWVKPESDRSYREKRAREVVPKLKSGKRCRSNSKHGNDYSSKKHR